MSTAYSSAKQKYIGNGVTTEWGFDFPIQKHSELKVYLKRSGLPQVLLEEGVDYSFVTENTISFPIKTGEAKLQAADVLAMQRESVFESEYNFSNQQRLEPEEVMHADDNLERQIQELKRDSESSIKVLPTSSVDPTTLVEHVERLYVSVDNIDTVANDKANLDKVAGSITNVNTVAGDIESVKTVANNIESVVVDATNISHIKTVAGSIANVNKTAGSINNVNVVAPSISSVNTVATNISSVNTAASNIAAIQYAPTAATNAAQSAANAANSATASANSATASANSANNSHIWAEGTDAQVQALGGVHSSKVWAEQSTNANIALTNSPYTTNRILEIPQDIKLELNNGTLKLKTGSKFYVPNGSGVFNTITMNVDAILGQLWGANNQAFVFYTPALGTLNLRAPANCSSGPTDSLSGQFHFWYDTENNLIKAVEASGNARAEYLSFPLALVTMTGDGTANVTSIDQIFNGFGYIGSTVFALPGVKGEIANGRNQDGTCKSLLTTLASVKTQTSTDAARRGWYLQPNGASIGNPPVYSDTQPSQNYIRWFSQKDNQWYNTQGSPELNNKSYILPLAVFNTDSTGKITSFEPYTVDSVVNSNLSNLSAAGQAKFDAKANVSNTVTTDTAQTISGVKTFNSGTLQALRPILLKEDNANEGGQIGFQRSNNSVLKGDPCIDLLTNTIRFVGTNSNNTTNSTLKVDLENNQVLVPTPAANANDAQAATTAWFNSKMQVVSALPAAPNANVFYFIPE